MSYNVDSGQVVDNLFEELKAKQVEIVKTPGKVFWRGYSGYITDPGGNLWGIAYNPFL